MSARGVEHALARPSGSAMRMEDSDIKNLARIDRQRAFELITRKYRDRLFQHAVYMLKDPQEAYDLTQETLIRAYQEPAFFDSEFKIRAWLFRVITNLCYNLTRDKGRRGGIIKTLSKTTLREPLQAIDEVLAKERRRSVARALERVPEKYRTILLLKYYNDMSYNEISATLGCKLGTVMSRLSRAREKLQYAIESNH